MDAPTFGLEPAGNPASVANLKGDFGRRMVTWAARLVPFLVFLVVYLPAAGHGFIADDFGWILHSRARSLADIVALLQSDSGFYRPVVALSFTANELLFGVASKPYGVVNLVLALFCGLSVLWLVRSLGGTASEGWLAACMWLLNFHGINMAILWISGRTALLLVFFSVTCAALLHAGRLGWALAALTLAMFSKEEAVVLPFLLYLAMIIRERAGYPRVANPTRWALSSLLPLGAYLLARAGTGAMTPATAPHYYRFTLEPHIVARNIAEYADRALTWPIVIAIIAFAVLRPSRSWREGNVRASVLYGLLWVAGSYALTVFLPVRSSLYACLPAVGACVASAAVCAAAWEHSSAGRRRAALAVAVILPVILSPVYLLRTRRWVSLAEFSSQALIDIDQGTTNVRNGAVIEVLDDRTRRASVASAFGGLLDEAAALILNKQYTFWVEPPRPGLDDVRERPCPICIDVRLTVKDGRVVRR